MERRLSFCPRSSTHACLAFRNELKQVSVQSVSGTRVSSSGVHRHIYSAPCVLRVFENSTSVVVFENFVQKKNSSLLVVLFSPIAPILRVGEFQCFDHLLVCKAQKLTMVLLSSLLKALSSYKMVLLKDLQIVIVKSFFSQLCHCCVSFVSYILTKSYIHISGSTICRRFQVPWLFFSKCYLPLMHGWWSGLLAKLEALEGAVAQILDLYGDSENYNCQNAKRQFEYSA